MSEINKNITIPISQVPTYARTQTVTAPNGEVRSWSDVLESNPDYEIWVDSETLEPIHPSNTDTSSQNVLENQASNYLSSSSKNNNKGFDIYNGANPKTLWMRRALDDPDNPGNQLADITAGVGEFFLTGGFGKMLYTPAKYAAKELFKQGFKNALKRTGKNSWRFIKGPGRKFAGYTAGALAVDGIANEIYQGVTGSNNHFMDDAADAIGINNIKNPWVREPVRFAFYGTNPTGWLPTTPVANATQQLINYSKNNIREQLLNHTLKRGMSLKKGKDLDYALRDLHDYNVRKQMEGINAPELYGLGYSEELVNSGLIDSYAGRPVIGGNNKYYVRTSAPGNQVSTGVKDVVDNRLVNPDRPVFLSAGEPWKEFSNANTIHEFPLKAFGKRSSVDWNGVSTGVDVFDVYNGYTGPNPGYISGVSHPMAFQISPRNAYTGFQTTVPAEDYVKGFMNYPHTTYERRMLGDIPYVQRIEYTPFNSGLSNIPKRETKLSFSNPEQVATAPVTPSWSLQKLPGYQLKLLMEGSPLEKAISKNGTININSLNALLKNSSKLEQEVINKVINEKFQGQKFIDYNQLRKSVQDELITYSRKPQEQYQTYGMEKLGFNVIADIGDPKLSFIPNVKTQTFTFESPRIKFGSDKHYDSETLGHSRTYTTPEEPDVLHVMESQSDWGQEKPLKRYTIEQAQNRYDRVLQHDQQALDEISRMEQNLKEGIRPDGQKIQYKWEIDQISDLIASERNRLEHNAYMKQQLEQILYPEKYVQENYLKQNYLQRQLQENMKFAAENNQTRMRYPTPETAAKIEGYQKKIGAYNPNLDDASKIELEQLFNRYVKENPNSLFNYYTGDITDLFLQLTKPGELPTYWHGELLDYLRNRPELYKKFYSFDYIPEHQTILKKYADFPKQYQKLFGKNSAVRTVTDSKGNTWYEVDIPQNYLDGTAEMQFKKGGTMKRKDKINFKKKPLLKYGRT